MNPARSAAPNPAENDGGWSIDRLAVIVMVAIAVIFDGFDSTILGLVVERVSRDLGVSMSGFAVIFAISLGGMAIGTFVGGLAGDRIGRRWPVIVSLFVLGVSTLAAASAAGLTEFAVLRFVAALALGALLPNSTALVGEFAPSKWRSAAVMLVMMSMPIGSISASLLAARFGDVVGWRGLFVAGGALPLIYSVVLLSRLPESPRFLMGKSRVIADKNVAEGDVVAGPDASAIGQPGKASVAGLFAPGLRWDTVALTAAFFYSMLSVYCFNSWLPTAIAALDLGASTTGLLTASYHSGSVLGIPFGAWALSRMGSRYLLFMLCLVATIGEVCLAVFGLDGIGSVLGISLVLTITAAANAVVAVALYSLGVHVYPVAMRTTGVGFVIGLGRIGALVSAGAAAYAIAIAQTAGFFSLVALATALTGISLLVLRSHIPSAVVSTRG